MEMSVFHGVTELTVQEELEIAVEAHFLRVFLREGIGLLGAVGGIFSPLGEVRRSVDVTQYAENGVREEPVLVFLNKGGVRWRLRVLLDGVVLTEHLKLGLIHGLIVYLGKLFKFFLLCLVCGILADSGLRQMEELRVQGE